MKLNIDRHKFLSVSLSGWRVTVVTLSDQIMKMLSQIDNINQKINILYEQEIDVTAPQMLKRVADLNAMLSTFKAGVAALENFDTEPISTGLTARASVDYSQYIWPQNGPDGNWSVDDITSWMEAQNPKIAYEVTDSRTELLLKIEVAMIA